MDIVRLWAKNLGIVIGVLLVLFFDPRIVYGGPPANACYCNWQSCVYHRYYTQCNGITTPCGALPGVCPDYSVYSCTYGNPNGFCTASSTCTNELDGTSIPCSACNEGYGDLDHVSCNTDPYNCVASCGAGLTPPPGNECYGWHEGSCGGAGCSANQRYQSRYCTATGWETECHSPDPTIGCLCTSGDNPNGLSAEYFDYPEQDSDIRYWTYGAIERTRYDSSINFDWQWYAPDVGDTSGAQVDQHRFMARWSGYITVPSTGTWTFTAKTDNVAKVTIDSSTVINTWGLPDATSEVGDTGLVVAQIHVDFDGPTNGYTWVRDHDFADQAVATINDNWERRNYICQCVGCAEDPGDDQYYCTAAQGCDNGCGYAQPPGYVAFTNLSGSNMFSVAIPDYGGVEYMLHHVDMVRCDPDWTNCATTYYYASGGVGAKNSYLLDFGTGGADPWKVYSMEFFFEPLLPGYVPNRGETISGTPISLSAGSHPISIEYSDLKKCISGDPCDSWVKSEAVLGLYYSGPSTAYQLVPSANLTACECTSDCSAGNCGQSDGCGVGVCGTGDTGSPSQPTCNNLGTVYVGTTTIGWSPDTTGLADIYQYQVDSGAVSETSVGITNASISYSSGVHTYKARSSNDTCESIGVGRTYASSWSSSCSFCYETSSCSVECGQDIDCSTCASTDAITPGVVTIAAPRGSTSAPTPYTTPTIAVQWNTDELNHTTATDHYNYSIYRTDTSVGYTGLTANNSVSSVGVTMGVGTTGVIYRWRVRGVNDSCSGYTAGITYGGWSSYGYYCWEGELCNLECGQDRTCANNGSCSSVDAITPGPMGINSPIGTTNVPITYTTPSVNLSWGITETNHADTDYYRYESYRTSNGVGFSGNTANNTVSSVGVTMGVGATGVTYRWRVRAENNTCYGYPAGATVGSWSSYGYYCWEGELCVPGNQCGQTKDCAGNGSCTNVDGGVPEQVTIVSPIGPSIGDPTVYNDVSTLTLQWQNTEVGHTYTDYYNYQVIKVGGSNPSNVGTTFYGVGSTVARTAVSVGISGTRGDIYEWKVRAMNVNCPPTDYGPDSDLGFFVLNRTPTTPAFTILMSSGATVPAEAYGVGQSGNHICDTRFASRQLRFVVDAYDLDGGDTINEVELKFGATGWIRGVGLTGATPIWENSGGGLSFYNTPSTSVAGTRRRVIFPVEMSTDFPIGIYDLVIDTVDMWGRARDNVDTNRDFKNWDCQVPIVGNLYDSSSTNGPVCPTTGYDNLYIGTSFTSLVFDGPGSDNPAMNVTVPNSFASGGTLTWGANYIPTFNADLDMTDPINGQRAIDLGNLGNGATSCPGGMLTVNNTTLSAYSDNPSLRVDFSGIQDQEPWYQAVGGGIRAKTRVICNVPPTCEFNPSCRPGMSIDSTVLSVGESDNSLVSAVAIDDSNGCDFLDGSCRYGIPNNWYLSGVDGDIWGENYTYKSLYDKYFGGLGLGITYPAGTAMSNIGATGVVFVDGDFNVDVNNSLTNSQFLMIVVRGEVVIDEAVTTSAGIFVADGGIRVEGTSNNQLTIDGMLYSAITDINLTRGYSDKQSNNTSPAVIINYKPSLIFNMPVDLVKVLSGWREGN